MTVNLFTLLTSTGSYQNVVSRDVYGKKTGGTVVTFKCHVKFTRNESYTPEGNTITYMGTLYMDGVYDIQNNAILTLPDGKQPKISSVNVFYDETGLPHHTTVNFEG